MKGFFYYAFLTLLAVCTLSGYVPPQDRKYIDYFLKLQAAELFRSKSFLLNSAHGYISQDCLDRVDIRFSYYRAMTQDQTRKVVVEIAQELLDQINGDPTLREKNLIREPFSVNKLHLEIRMDNIMSANCDPPNIQKVTLERGILTYRTFPISTMYYGKASSYKESFEYALMLLNEPTEFGVPCFGHPGVVVEKGVEVPIESMSALSEKSSAQFQQVTYPQEPTTNFFSKPQPRKEEKTPAISVTSQEINVYALGKVSSPAQNVAPKTEEAFSALSSSGKLPQQKTVDLHKLDQLGIPSTSTAPQKQNSDTTNNLTSSVNATNYQHSQAMVAYERIEDQLPKDNGALQESQDIHRLLQSFTKKNASTLTLSEETADSTPQAIEEDVKEPKKPSFFKRIWRSIFGDSKKKEVKKSEETSTTPQQVADEESPPSHPLQYSDSPEDRDMYPLPEMVATEAVPDDEVQPLTEEEPSEAEKPAHVFGWLFGWFLDPSPDEKVTFVDVNSKSNTEDKEEAP